MDALENCPHISISFLSIEHATLSSRNLEKTKQNRAKNQPTSSFPRYYLRFKWVRYKFLFMRIFLSLYAYSEQSMNIGHETVMRRSYPENVLT